ncbi:Hypothetical protein CINCED_3A004838, partial [Cinara cedri]
MNFIDAYRNIPKLWDIECSLYPNQIEKAATYNVLVKKLKPIESDVTRDSIIKKNKQPSINFSEKIIKGIQKDRGTG